MTAVLILLAHGCPPQAIVAACGLDERTVAAWLHRAGAHGQAVHAHRVERGDLDLGQGQADKIRVTVRGGAVWQAMAVALPSRLWLGGVVSPTRDGALVTRLLRRVGAGAATAAFLLCVDGFAAYVGAARAVFRAPVYSGKPGRPQLRLPDGFLLAQVVKSPKGRRLAEVVRRVVVGTEEAVARAIVATRGGTVITTSYIERLNATVRAHLAPLARRGRGLAQGTALIASGLWLVGSADNFCWTHQSLRLRAIGGRTWLERTPAMAAGLTDHVWSREELLRSPVPPADPIAVPHPRPRRRRGRGDGVLIPFPRARTRPPHAPSGNAA